MRAIILSREARDYSRTVAEFVRDFYRDNGREFEVISPDTREGDSLARLYDVTLYPTILILDNNGKMVNNWRGMPLPRMSEVLAYMLD